MANWYRSPPDKTSNFTTFFLENEEKYYWQKCQFDGLIYNVSEREPLFEYIFRYMNVDIVCHLEEMQDWSDLYKEPRYNYDFQFQNKKLLDLDKKVYDKYGYDYVCLTNRITQDIPSAKRQRTWSVKMEYRLPFSSSGFKSVAGLFLNELITKKEIMIDTMIKIVKGQTIDKDFIQWNNRRLRNDYDK